MTTSVSRAMFNQADLNRDGVVDQAEFSNWVSGGPVASSGVTAYESTGYFGQGEVVDTAFAGMSGAYESTVSMGADAANAAYVVSGGVGYDAASTAYGTQTAVQHYATDANGNYIDSSPEIIRRPAATGVQTYTQNVSLRFLQPPAVPPPGPLIIREVRPPQPPPPAPLRLRQQAPPLPTPPPLVLRERPPAPPAPIASQTVIRRLAAIPVPPRSVIIERLPPLPRRPRDIVLERWLPYGPRPRRRTMLQRAGAAVQYARPRNVVIQYDPVGVRVVRQIHRLGVMQANPVTYYNQYGATLLDAASLMSQARAAGVVEDISATGMVGYNTGAVASWSEMDGGVSVEGMGEGFYGWGTGSAMMESGMVGGVMTGGVMGGVDLANAAFNSADVNADGVLDQAEFSQFVHQGL